MGPLAVFLDNALDLLRGLGDVSVRAHAQLIGQLPGLTVIVGDCLAEGHGRDEEPFGGDMSFTDQPADPIQGVPARFADGLEGLGHDPPGEKSANADVVKGPHDRRFQIRKMEGVAVVDDRGHTRLQQTDGAEHRAAVVVLFDEALVHLPAGAEVGVQLQPLAEGQAGRQIPQVVVHVDQAGQDDTLAGLQGAGGLVGGVQFIRRSCGDDAVSADRDGTAEDPIFVVEGDENPVTD